MMSAKQSDPHDHVAAGLDALGESITPRTRWLIEHPMLAHKLTAGTLGHRVKLRLQAGGNFDDLMRLHAFDRAGHNGLRGE